MTSMTSPDALTAMTAKDLIDHLLQRYHQVRRRELPDIVALARKVERVHHDVPDAPIGLAEALDRIALELALHMEVEERVLFPAMLHNLESAVAHPIAMMRQEHDGYESELAKVEELARGFVLPAGACGSWQRLDEGVAWLCRELREQIRIENDILFARFDMAPKTGCTCAHAGAVEEPA